MKALHTLIKLRKRDIDETRKQLSMLEDEKAKALANIMTIEQEVARETNASEAALGWADMLAEFLARMDRRKESQKQKVLRIDARMAQLYSRLSDQFAEMKKYEIARDNRLAEEKKLLEKQMQTMLDEIGGQLHRRKVMKEGM